MADFDQLKRHLDQRFAGALTCKLGKNGEAPGLLIKCPTREGHVFVTEFARDGSALLSLYDSAEDSNPEVWTIMRADEAADRIHPWAFPTEWARPQPLDVRGTRSSLQKLSRGLKGRTENVECRVVASNHNLLRLLTDDSRKQLEHDVEIVCPERIIANFPWDVNGNLLLKTAVVLRRYETSERPGKDREVCLAAIGPELRSDDQLIRVQLLDPIVVNQDHRWDAQLWMWTSEDIPPEKFWGAGALIDSASRIEDTVPIDMAGKSPEDRANYAVHLLDAGYIEEALQLYGVTFSDDLHRLIGGQRIAPPSCCAHPDATWRRSLIDGLRQCAPWLLPRALADEYPQRSSLKLLTFPGQFHSRRACLMLTAEHDGRDPKLVIENTGSNARLHESAWKRPLWVELARFGLLAVSLVIWSLYSFPSLAQNEQTQGSAWANMDPAKRAEILKKLGSADPETLEQFRRLAQLKQRLGKTKPVARVASKWIADADKNVGTGNYLRKIQSGQRKRWYEVHVPRQYKRSVKTPVVLVIHGGGGNPDQQRFDSQMDQFSDRYGFIAVYPAGTSGYDPERLLTWNAKFCCGYSMKNNIDDVQFVRDLLDDLGTKFTIDRKRVFATGLSNGAVMSYRLAAECSDRIAAIAPIAAPAEARVFDSPVRKVPIIHFHGMLDKNAPYNGGVGERSIARVNFPPVRQAIAGWLTLYNMKTKPAKTVKKGRALGEYFGGKDDASATVILWPLPDGGHTWPGARLSEAEQALNLGPVNRDISACDLMWRFFQHHPMP